MANCIFPLTVITLAISTFLGLQYKLPVSVRSGNFSSVCISLCGTVSKEHRVILEGKHYLSTKNM